VRFSRLLIVRACAVGDFVMNLLALSALAVAEPQARFTLVGYPTTLALARIFLPVEAIHSIESPPWSSLFAGSLDPQTLGAFDAAVVWMKDPIFAENLRQSGVVSVIHATPFSRDVHAAEHLLGTIGLPAPELPDLWRPSSNRIIVHPGSGSPAKCWPYFGELVESISDAVVLIGPCETDFQTRAPGLKDLSLPQVAEELQHCRCFVGNDSGITHLAAYLGCPTVALFGPTDPRIWGPIGRRVRVLKNFPLDAISVAEVKKHLL
jgi:ADP-heptose:LPS heptosyltransferase